MSLISFALKFLTYNSCVRSYYPSLPYFSITTIAFVPLFISSRIPYLQSLIVPLLTFPNLFITYNIGLSPSHHSIHPLLYNHLLLLTYHDHSAPVPVFLAPCTGLLGTWKWDLAIFNVQCIFQRTQLLCPGKYMKSGQYRRAQHGVRFLPLFYLLLINPFSSYLHWFSLAVEGVY